MSQCREGGHEVDHKSIWSLRGLVQEPQVADTQRQLEESDTKLIERSSRKVNLE